MEDLPISVTTIRRSMEIHGQAVHEYKGAFTDSNGSTFKFLASQTSRSDDPQSFYSPQKEIDASFEIRGFLKPALEYIGSSLGIKEGMETKTDSYQLSLWDKNNRRYNVLASVRYAKTNADKWLPVTGNFLLVQTSLDPKHNQVILDLTGPGIAESILIYPKKLP